MEPDDILAVAGFILLIVCVVVVAVAGGYLLDERSCHAKWDRAGFVAVDFGFFQGCIVKLPDGRWLPTDRLREMDLPKK